MYSSHASVFSCPKLSRYHMDTNHLWTVLPLLFFLGKKKKSRKFIPPEYSQYNMDNRTDNKTTFRNINPWLYLLNYSKFLLSYMNVAIQSCWHERKLCNNMKKLHTEPFSTHAALGGGWGCVCACVCWNLRQRFTKHRKDDQTLHYKAVKASYAG